jgi:hypothetical protein
MTGEPTDRASRCPANPIPTSRAGWPNWRRRTGPAFDRDYANLLRAARGKVFSTLAVVQAGTRNSEIRKFAGEGMDCRKPRSRSTVRD